MKNYRWLIYWLYAGMALTLSGCHQGCMVKDPTVTPLQAELLPNGCYRYRMDRSVTLTRPLRIYPERAQDAGMEAVGNGFMESFDVMSLVEALDGRSYVEIPAGTTIVLRVFIMRENESYWLIFDVPERFPPGIILNYFLGCDHKIAPLPWAGTIKPEEPFHPADIEKLFPGGKWGD